MRFPENAVVVEFQEAGETEKTERRFDTRPNQKYNRKRCFDTKAQRTKLKNEPERGQAVTSQTHVLKSGGSFARLANDYTQRQP